MMHPPAEVFTDILDYHGHYCPMSTLGGRMGWAARRRLEAAGVDNGLRATVYARTCALDGISRTTGCTEGAGTLVVRTTGEHRLDLCGPDGTGIAVRLTAAALQSAGDYRQASAALESVRASLPEPQLHEREAALTVQLDELLAAFRRQPDTELLDIVPLPSAVEG